ncbi:MAG: hypothetical protein ACR2QO_24280 [Acidimicrobiales bacterium]
MRKPEIAREITSYWICTVPSEDAVWISAGDAVTDDRPLFRATRCAAR